MNYSFGNVITATVSMHITKLWIADVMECVMKVVKTVMNSA